MLFQTTTGKIMPIESHKINIVQSISLLPIDIRLEVMKNAGFNTFLLGSKDVFIDLLTDSGTNALSNTQLSAMMKPDDAYAGSESFTRVKEAVKDVLGFDFVLPVHQGRAAEHLLSKTFIKPGNIVITNFHFTTAKAHTLLAGGTMEELCIDEAFHTKSTHPFKGNMDIAKLNLAIKKHGVGNIAFIRMEATTNLLGGQPFSMENLKKVSHIAKKHNIPLVFDGSLIAENAIFIKKREKGFEDISVLAIIKQMMSLVDVFYFSARKSSSSRGGLIATNNKAIHDRIQPFIYIFEGFITYGGMSSREMESMAVGIREMANDDVAGTVVDFVQFFVNRCEEEGIPVVTPAGGLACHVDAKLFLPHVPSLSYPAGALAAAMFLVSGVRGMERGTISMERDNKGNEVPSELELLRLAVPRRVFTVSHIEFTIARLKWLLEHRDIISGLTFTEEPKIMRFFTGKLKAVDGWDETLVHACKKDIGDM